MSPVIRGPQCFNELATRSVLAWHRFTTRRLFGGLDTEQVEDAVQAALESGELSLPEPGAMSYMLSSEQILTPRGGRWVPHIMLYTPFANGRELYGTEGPDMSLPFVTDQGGPWAITVVVVREFSDGSRIETR